MGLREVYRQQFKTTFASFVQYRASIFIWTIDRILEPLIYLVVWSAVAKATGGSVGEFDARRLAAYFILMMLVTQLTYTWVTYEYEYKIRHGSLSFAIFRGCRMMVGIGAACKAGLTAIAAQTLSRATCAA